MACKDGERKKALVALVVDDEPSIRVLVTSLLKKHGFEVVEAEHGGQAISLLEKKRLCVDLLVTDVIMPEVDGITVADSFLRECQSTRVVLMSGYLDRAKISFASDGRWTYVPKPFTPPSLLQAIQKLLEMPPRPSEPSPVRPAQSRPDDRLTKNVPRILIVDEEPGILSLLRLVFVQAGYEVSTAESSTAAMALCGSQRFDILLSDVRVQGLDGHALAQWLVARQPSCRPVLMSAFHVDCQECPLAPHCTLIDKPFSLDTILTVVEDEVRSAAA